MLYKKNILIFTLFFALNVFTQQSEIKNITTQNGLPSNLIHSIKQDTIGFLWVATNKGLVKYDGKNFSQITKLKTTSLSIKNNVIYAGLENGLLVIKNGREYFFESKPIQKIFFFNTKIYVATTQGIYVLKNTYLQPLHINTTLDFSTINDILFLKDSYYIATQKGLWELNNLEKAKKVQKISNQHIVSLTRFKNKLIAATLKKGIQIFYNNTLEKTIKTLYNVTSIKRFKNQIWVTSDKNGIEIFTLPSFRFKQKINKYNSLTTNFINTVFKDKQNSFWIASNKGLYNFKSADTFFSKQKIPVVFFEKLLVNHQKSDSLLSKKVFVNFSSTENNISIHFKTIDLQQPYKVYYRYQLTNEFSPWSTNNIVQFANLSAGKYHFKIQSKVNDKVSKINSFLFKINNPFYKKAWFTFIISILFLLLTYLFLSLYLKKTAKKTTAKLKELKLENHLLTLEQKALQLQMNPHFIFNVLNGIKALGNTGNINELNTTISQFSILLRGILNNSRKEEISLKEEIETLKNYIVLEQKMNSKIFDFNIDTNLNTIDADEILIPPMLIQPFIENSILHGFQLNKKGVLQVSFTVKNNFLHCTIIDNGIGIYQSKKQKEKINHKSIALKVSKERIENISIKNSFSINEILENDIIKGTKIWFKIPLKTDY